MFSKQHTVKDIPAQ